MCWTSSPRGLRINLQVFVGETHGIRKRRYFTCDRDGEGALPPPVTLPPGEDIRTRWCTGLVYPLSRAEVLLNSIAIL